MDIQMPILDGYESTKKIRELDKDIPIIALSANAMKEDLIKTKNAGMNTHITKPIVADNLYKVIIEYLDYTSLTKDINVQENLEIISIEKGLKKLAGNKDLFEKVLANFYEKYLNIKLHDLEESELFEISHALKGLSGNIGALKLESSIVQFDKTKDLTLLDECQSDLENVFEKIKEILNIK